MKLRRSKRTYTRAWQARKSYERHIEDPKRLNKGDPWHGLMGGIVLQALTDLNGRDALDVAATLEWWLNDGPSYLAVLEIDFSPWEYIVSN